MPGSDNGNAADGLSQAVSSAGDALGDVFGGLLPWDASPGEIVDAVTFLGSEALAQAPPGVI